MEWYHYWLWLWSILIVIGIALNIALVGKPREPLTGATAAITTLIGFITLIALYNVLT